MPAHREGHGCRSGSAPELHALCRAVPDHAVGNTGVQAQKKLLRVCACCDEDLRWKACALQRLQCHVVDTKNVEVL